MATFNKFNAYTRNLVNGVHNFTSNTIKVLLTNTAPAATNAVRADLTEIAAGNGYASGGLAAASTVTLTGGTAKVTLADVTFTASGGPVGPFRYAVVYDDTPTSPVDPLIGWVDYGSAVTLATGESLAVDFDDANGALTVA